MLFKNILGGQYFIDSEVRLCRRLHNDVYVYDNDVGSRVNCMNMATGDLVWVRRGEPVIFVGSLPDNVDGVDDDKED